jgi:3-oxoacyl-[acyl-carrier protein] reductase
MKKTVLVTGASRGIGRAIAIKLASDDYVVGVNYLNNPDKASEVVNIIENNGGEALLLKADMTQPEDIKDMITSFTNNYGNVYGLINNAAIYIRKILSDLTLDDWNETIKTNLTGPFLCVKSALPHMSGSGRIINITSELAHKGTSHGAHYAASKAALIGLTKSLARELAPRSITVNAIAPGPIDTDIIAGDTPEKRRERENTIPLGRVGDPEDVAGLVAFLMSDDAGYITGSVMNVNGGLLML